MNDREAERRAFLRDLALLLGVPFAGIVILLGVWQPWRPSFELAGDTDIYAVAAGTWDWAGADAFCQRNPHTISFSADRKVMTYRQSEAWTDGAGVSHQEAEYDLQEVSRRHLRGRIRGELRRTDAGEPVVWDLVLTSDDSYRWHRTDWPFWAYSDDVRRCAPSLDSTTVGEQ